jgi:hypothetical protein
VAFAAADLLQGDASISGRVAIDAKYCSADKVAGAVWADGKFEMSGA